MKKIFLLIAVALVIVITFSFLSTDNYAINADSFKKQLLDRHNFHRYVHAAPPLVWNDTIANYAQEWAEKNARANRMFHRTAHKYGENIYMMSGGTPTGNQVVDSWYSEIKYYNFNRPGFGYNTGHFTQVVWKSTKQLGCGWANSSNGGIYVVCNYSPAGNITNPGRFAANVLRGR